MLIKSQNSPNYSNKTRNLKDIKFIIIHYTGMQSKIESIKRLINPKSKVSCHYLIDRKGAILEMVKINKIAWHAGKSKWKNHLNLNKISIGIELVNKGHQFGYEKFTNIQINNLIKLCKILKKKLKIKKQNILGHSDIAPTRKQDPGEKFPWKKLNHNHLGRWYKKKKLIIDKTLSNKQIHQIFFKNLFKIGYRYFEPNLNTVNNKLAIKAFQRHFNQSNISGKIDEKTLKISHFLAVKKNN